MTKSLLTVKQLSKKFPAFSENSLRFHIFNAESRKNSRNEVIQGNGLASALFRIGKKVLVDEGRFLEWVEQHRCADSASSRNV